MAVNFDSNSRTVPCIHDAGIENIPFSAQVQRVAKVALPFIYLYKPAQNILTVGFALLYVRKAVMDLRKDAQTKNWGQFRTHLREMAISTAMHAIPLFAPRMAQGAVVLQNVWKLYKAQTSAERRNAAYECVSSLAHFASKCSSMPEFLFPSLIFEALSEFRHSYTEFAAGNYLEAFSNAALGAIRVYSARKPFFTMKREYFGKEMDQQAWDAFKGQVALEEGNLTVATAKLRGVIDVEKYMIDHEYKSVFNHIKIFDKNENLERFQIKNLRFNHCDFREAKMQLGQFVNVTFDQCNCRDADFFGALFEKVVFKGCDVRRTNFARTRSFNLSFSDSDLKGVSFNDSVHHDFSIENSLLEGTNFFGAQFYEAIMKACDLTNCLLTTAKDQFRYEACTENIFTKPVVALTWNFADSQVCAGLTHQVLAEKDFIALRFEYCPEEIDSRGLQEEINVLAIAADRVKNRAQFILSQRKVGFEMDKLVKKAALVHQYSDAVILSGGLDVEKVFYVDGRLLEEEDFVEAKRSILEFALIEEAEKNHKPLLGICRGCQMVNVYFGGTLHDVNRDNHFGVVKAFDFASTRVASALAVQQLFPEGITGWSGHHQACDTIGETLTVVAEQDGVPKLLVNQYGNIILTQYHPEMYISARKTMEPGYIERRREELRREYGMYRWLIRLMIVEFLILAECEYMEKAPEVVKNERLYDFFLQGVRTARRRVAAARSST